MKSDIIRYFRKLMSYLGVVKLWIFNYLAGYDFMILLVNTLIFHDTKFIHIHPNIQLLHRGKTNSSENTQSIYVFCWLSYYDISPMKKRSWRNGAKCTRFLESGKSSPESCVIFNDTNLPPTPQKKLQPPHFIESGAATVLIESNSNLWRKWSLKSIRHHSMLVSPLTTYK